MRQNEKTMINLDRERVLFDDFDEAHQDDIHLPDFEDLRIYSRNLVVVVQSVEQVRMMDLILVMFFLSLVDDLRRDHLPEKLKQRKKSQVILTYTKFVKYHFLILFLVLRLM